MSQGVRAAFVSARAVLKDISKFKYAATFSSSLGRLYHAVKLDGSKQEQALLTLPDSCSSLHKLFPTADNFMESFVSDWRHAFSDRPFWISPLFDFPKRGSFES
jgi:hypothetical protein